MNRRGPRVYGRIPPLEPVSVTSVVARQAEGAVVVDVRPVEEFAAGHVPKALSIPLRPQFASWLGWLVPRDAPILFVLDDDQDEADLVRQCLTIGYERLAGRLAGGIDAWPAAGQPVSTVALVLPEDTAGTLLDVRQRSEFEAGHVPGAVNVELGDTPDPATSLPPGPLTIMCGHGERAMSAASILAARGRSDLSVLVGGPADVVATRRQRLA